MSIIGKNTKLTFIILTTFWICVISIIFISSVPINPLTKTLQKKGLFIFLPQGWAFFTRNPKEDNIYVYKRVNGVWLSQTQPNSTYYLGAGRDMRFQGVQIDHLLSQIDLDDLKECESIEKCNFVEVSVTNHVRFPNLCGQILIVLKEPVPWAWAYHGKKINMPVKGIICNVKCNGSSN